MLLRVSPVTLVLDIYPMLLCLSPRVLQGQWLRKGVNNPGIRFKTTLNKNTGEKSIEKNDVKIS